MKTNDEKQPKVSLSLFVPAEIGEVLRKLAKQNDRSLSGEAVRALREYVGRHKDEQ